MDGRTRRPETAGIHNPVLPGSHPDPSILRVGEDYYLATSTFEWYPGVRLHHSRDLVHRRPLGGALDGPRLLDLTGCPDSGGVWAPDLTHAGGLFHLVYGNVSGYTGGFTDCPNLLVTAPTAEGPWSDPVPLHARGLDASLFHDTDTSWLVNLVHDWRPGHGGSAGLEATRYDRAGRRLVGEPVPLLLPPRAGWIEGPNLHRRGDRYYLITADGGTGYGHQVTVARSRTLAGPYEPDPAAPDWITATERPGGLRLRGGRSPQSLTGASLAARRATARHCTFEAAVDFAPTGFQHLAGITAYCNTCNWYFLHLTADDTGRTVLRRAGCDRGVTTVDETGQQPVTAGTTVRLGLDLDGPQLRLRYDHGDGWQPFGPPLDATVHSDEHAEEHDPGGIRALGFTGAFLGLRARDLTGRGHHADFHDPQYRTRAR